MREGFYLLKDKKVKFVRLEDNLQELSYRNVVDADKDPKKSIPLRGLKIKHFSESELLLVAGKKEKKFKGLSEKEGV